MSREQADALDLELAWRRVKADMGGLHFVRHPFEARLAEVDLPVWLSSLRDEIAADHYHPGTQTIIDIPKARGAVRPGSLLSLRDCVVYYACVGACLHGVISQVRWAYPIDFSHRLTHDPSLPKWIVSQFNGWTMFREKSLARLEEGYSYLVSADIASYYENIDIATLIYDLRAAGIPPQVVSLLSVCLNRWSEAMVAGRSIPQGYSASDILAKLYLNSVDHNLVATGYSHFRYVDDVRIFCRSLPEARRALIEVSSLLRGRGLQLATEKLEVHRADSASRWIAGISPIIHTVQSNLIDQVVAVFGLDTPYLDIWEVDEIVSANPDSAPLDLIRETYQSYFIDTSAKFNKTLFRYLLKRLGSARDDFAIENCIVQFERSPQETRAILRYVSAVSAEPVFEGFLARYFTSDRATYEFQLYEALEWYFASKRRPGEAMLDVVRSAAFDDARPLYAKAVARALLGVHGVQGDLERLQATYTRAGGDLEKAELMCAVKRMELGRRNAFLSRAETDGEIQRLAGLLVRRS